ncbi:CDP-glycerol--glycerophosphate glycerophosphotransferase [Lederbergia ruris]|uniref:CDP-glycerol--glycerophosphate glycerophosphotransferase n=1 Tax=Lederbergia ruris TaxID=217495 RepID=A0ABQ4KLJ9_9BACI|nr:CDP-glycerol glycerophosphotransferase family protein [Lederbergia ruris]GIN58830.1 CDP-glycerol--glycerophosphate glycerophosphotransferase [Lederbergia ruris]
MNVIIQRIKRKPLIRKLFMNSIGTILKVFMFTCNKILGVDNNKIVFISFGGKYYSGNPKAISEKLNQLDSNLKIVWLFHDPDEKNDVVPKYVIRKKVYSLTGIKALATAKVWVDNSCKPLFIYKSKKQKYIQTWHGDRGFKKVVLDSPHVTKDFRILESKICDLMVSGSDYGDKKFRSAFNYQGEILKYGCPRNDMLIENNPLRKKRIKRLLSIEENVKVLLYAPTYRHNAVNENKLQPSTFNLLNTIKELEDLTKNEWICIVRAHSSIRGLDNIPENNEKIINGNLIDDMNELLLISDFLITDYSSSAGDFALLNKPIILFQPDREKYIMGGKRLYFDLNNSPYWIAENNEELIELLKNIEWGSTGRNCKEILNFYGTKETGQASQKVAEYILDQIK